MSEWISIGDWARCRDLERPGIVFEIRNADDLRLLTPCTALPPDAPFDWLSPPLEFRPVAEAPPEHSSPLPEPKG